MHTCKTCPHWTEWKTTCERVDGDDLPSTRFDIHVKVADDHGLEVSLLTGPDFGCIYHPLNKQSPGV